MDDLLFFLVLSHPPMSVLNPMDVILPSSGIDAAVEEFCVCITLFQICNPSALALPSPLKHRQTNHPPLEPRAEVSLLGREGPLLLSNVKAENHKKGRVKLDLCPGEQPLAPLHETKRCFL